MSEHTAWVLDFGAGVRAAVGEFNLVHLVHEPQLFDVPATPSHCCQVLPWQAGLIPVWDLRGWLGAGGDDSAGPASIAGVVGFQRRHGGQAVYGAFLLSRPPARATIQDADACPLPDVPRSWRDAALACVEHAGAPLPILDLRRLFSDSLAVGSDSGR